MAESLTLEEMARHGFWGTLWSNDSDTRGENYFGVREAIGGIIPSSEKSLTGLDVDRCFLRYVMYHNQNDAVTEFLADIQA